MLTNMNLMFDIRYTHENACMFRYEDIFRWIEVYYNLSVTELLEDVVCIKVRGA